MNDEQLHDLAPLFAIDALDQEETAEFEAHLARCGRCRDEVRRYQEAMVVALDEEIEDVGVDAPPNLRAEVLASIAETDQVALQVPRATVGSAPTKVVSLEARRRPVARIMAGAAAAILILIGGVAVLSRQFSGDAVDTLVAAPDAETVVLEGDAGTLTVVYSASRDEVALIGDGFEDPGVGRVYELWFVLPDGVAPAALFNPSAEGKLRDVLSVDDQDGTAGFGVTIEPAGGSDQPTGDILLVGEF